MSLLLDRILAADLDVPDVELLRSATVIQANNVAQYLYGTNRKDPHNLTQDFPNIAPPWPNFFVEFAMPKTICEVTPEGSQMVQWEGPKTLGLHWMAGRRGSYDFDAQQSLFRTLSESSNTQIRSKYLEAAEQAAWFGHVHLYNDLQGSDPDGPVWLFLFPISSESQFFLCDHPAEYGSSSVVVIERPADPVRWPIPIKPTIHRVIWMAMAVSLMTLSFCNCKNVTIAPVSPPIGLSRKFERKHGKPLFRYNVINIQPITKMLDTEGGASVNGLKHALHICRGHFKDYKERGLFGKELLKGIYWWPAHVRGSPEQGITISDYRVTKS